MRGTVTASKRFRAWVSSTGGRACQNGHRPLRLHEVSPGPHIRKKKHGPMVDRGVFLWVWEYLAVRDRHSLRAPAVWVGRSPRAGDWLFLLGC